MKSSKILVFILITIGVNYFILACNNSSVNKNKTTEKQDSTRTISPKDSIPEIIKEDSLIQEYAVKVVDTFDTGEPLKIHYCNPDNPNEVKFEKQFYQSGKIFMEGALDNEKRTGKWVAWYDNGVIWSVGYFKDDLKHGASNVYYENGQIRYTKNYNMDKAEGLWEFYDEEGNQLGKVMYENGEIQWQEGVSE